MHAEIAVPQDCYGLLIGPKGSNLNHINANFGVSVNVPRDGSSVNKNVVVVGPPGKVAKATAHIRKQVLPADDEDDEEGGGGGGYGGGADAGGGGGAADAEAAADAEDAGEDGDEEGGEMAGFGGSAKGTTENAWGGGSGTSGW